MTSSIASNSLLNLLGQILPLLVGMAAIPPVLHGLGVEQFGILSLAWIILGYFSLFDFGLGRATTKLVAEQVVRNTGTSGASETARLIWSSVFLHLALGVVAGLVLWFGKRVAVCDLLGIPAASAAITIDVVAILALSLPAVLGAAALRGILEGTQRFGLVNGVKCVAGSLVFLAPLICVHAGWGLREIVLAILAVRIAALLAYLIVTFVVFPEMRSFPALSRSSMKSLASYAGWVAVSNFISPLLAYLERFMLVAVLASTRVLTLYSAPYEVVSRIAIIPASLAAALFPVMATCDARADSKKEQALYLRSTKILFLGLLPVLATLSLFAYPLLEAWLGRGFGGECTHVLRVLCAAFLANALAYLPYTLLYAKGRPDIKAKLDLLELPLFMAAAWLLIGRYGLAGAAYAKLFIAVLDAAALFVAAFFVSTSRVKDVRESGIVSAFMLGIGFFAVALMLGIADASPRMRVAVMALSAICYVALAWRFALDIGDRQALLLRRRTPTS